MLRHVLVWLKVSSKEASLRPKGESLGPYYSGKVVMVVVHFTIPFYRFKIPVFFRGHWSLGLVSEGALITACVTLFFVDELPVK